jgi:hypothetical protein
MGITVVLSAVGRQFSLSEASKFQNRPRLLIEAQRTRRLAKNSHSAGNDPETVSLVSQLIVPRTEVRRKNALV